MKHAETIALAIAGAAGAWLSVRWIRPARLPNPYTDAPPGCATDGTGAAGKCDRCGRKLKLPATRLRCSGVVVYCGSTCAAKWVTERRPAPAKRYRPREFYSDPAHPRADGRRPLWQRDLTNPGCCFLPYEKWTQDLRSYGAGQQRQQFAEIANEINNQSRFSQATAKKVVGRMAAQKAAAYAACQAYCDLAVIEGDGRRGDADIAIAPYRAEPGEAPASWLVYDARDWHPEDPSSRPTAEIIPTRYGWRLEDIRGEFLAELDDDRSLIWHNGTFTAVEKP